jgi:hypothetical protein
MEDYVIVGSKITPSPVNPVEETLKGVKHGLSLRQLREVTGLKNNMIKYYIYTSLNIADTDPFLHGSNKVKIRVFNYTENSANYFARKDKRKNVNLENTDETSKLQEVC